MSLLTKSQRLILSLLFIHFHAEAGIFTVTQTTDPGNTTTPGTLRYAITQANLDSGSIINFSLPNGSTINLNSPLPPLTTDVLINAANFAGGATGATNLTINGNGNSIFFAYSGTVDIIGAGVNGLRLSSGSSRGGNGANGNYSAGGGGLGAGGALFINGARTVQGGGGPASTLTVTNVNFINNQARGGDGGTGGVGVGTGGGGGMLGGAGGLGGVVLRSSSGGGGGIGGNGGDGGPAGSAGAVGLPGIIVGVASGGAGAGTGGVAGINGGGGGGGGTNSATTGVAGGGGGVGGAAGNGVDGGSGGFGGGGGGGVDINGVGGAGGFGGGGGGTYSLVAARGGFGGGSGGANGGNGGGGSGLGGAIFVAEGGRLTIKNTINTSFTGNTVTAGSGDGGEAHGTDIYLQTVTENVVFDISAAQQLTFNGTIAGLGGINKAVGASGGAGALLLLGNNPFSGGITNSAGTLVIGNANALGTGALVLSGGSLQSNAALTVANNYSLNAASSIGGMNNLTLNGTGNLNAHRLTINNTADTITLGGVMSGTGSITQNGTGGSLILLRNNTFNGGVASTAGTLVIGNANALGTGALVLSGGSLQSNAALTVANNYSLNAASSIGGINNLTLNGTGNLNAHRLTINNTANTITLGGVMSDGDEGAGSITQDAAGGSLVLLGNNTFTGGVTNNAGTLVIGNANALGTGALVLSGGSLQSNAALTIANNYSLNAASSIGGMNNLTLNGTGNLNAHRLTINNTAGTIILGGVMSDGDEGAGSIAQNGAGGSLVLLGSNTFTGGVSTAGTLVIGNANALGTGALALRGGSLQSGGVFTVANNYLLTAPSSIGGVNSLTLNGAGNLNAHRLTINNTAGIITLGGVISDGDAGTGSITQNGADTSLVLLGSNTFNGGVTSTAGTLVIGNANALGTGTLVLSGGSLQSNGAFTVANNYSLTAPSSIGGVNNLMLNGAGNLNAALTMSNAENTTITLGGVISGAGSIGQSDAGGSLVLLGSNTFTGGVSAAGTLVIGNANALGTGALALSGGSLQSNGAFTVANNYSLTAPSSIDGVNSLALNGVGNLNTHALTINNTGGTIALGGVISGAGSIAQNGAGGSLVLLGSNTFTGGVTSTAGTLVIGNANALGTRALVLSGGNLQSNGAFTVANNYSLNAPSSIGGVNNLTLNGAGHLNANALTINNTGGTITLGGVISDGDAGRGSIAQNGAGGSLVLLGSNTFTGGVTSTAGTLVIGNANALGTGALVLSGGNLQSNGAFTVANNYSLNAPSSIVSVNNLTLNGAGNLNAALTMNNAANTTITLGGAISGTGSIVQNGAGGSLVLLGSNTFTGGVTSTAGTLVIGNANALGTGALVFRGGSLQPNGAFTVANNYSLMAASSIGGVNNLTLNGAGNLNAALTMNNAANTTITLGGAISGTGSIVQNGAGGSLVLLGSNTFTGGVTSTAGTLVIGNDNALGSGTLVLSGGSLQSNGVFAVANNYSLNAASSIGGANSLTLNGTGHLNAALTVNNAANTTITLGGAISGTGSILLNSADLRSTLVLTGVNSYTGGTTIVKGTLQGTTDSLQGNITNNGMLAFNQNLNGIYAGNIIGNGGIINAGRGIVTLSGANNFGTLAINNGGINFTTNAQTITDLSGSGKLVLTGIDLTLGSGNSTTFSGNITGSGRLIKQGAGTLILAGNNNYTGGTTVTGGSLQGNLNSLPGNITNNGVLIFDEATDGTFTGTINGSGRLIKQNVGNLILSAAHTYTGGTSVNAGCLSVNGSIEGPVTVNSGATLRGTGYILGTVINNGIIFPGNSIGTLTISQDLNLGPNSITRIEINPQQSSIIKVLGTANLNGTLTIAAAPGAYLADTKYLLIDAKNITGSFSSFTPIVGPYRVGILYNADGVVAEIDFSISKLRPKLINTGADANVISVANYIDSLPVPAIGLDLGDSVIGPITNLLKGSELIAALENISPGRIAADTLVIQDFNILVNSLNTTRLDTLRYNRAHGGMDPRLYFNSALGKTQPDPLITLSQLSDKPYLSQRKRFSNTHNKFAINPMEPILKFGGLEANMWLQGLGYVSNQQAYKTDPGYDAKTDGIMAGIDYSPYKNTFVGAGLGYAKSLVHHDNRGGKDKLENYFTTLYGSWSAENWYVDASTMLSIMRSHTQQQIVFLTGTRAALDRSAVGKHSGFTVTPHIGVGYEFEFNENCIVPFASMDYSYIHEQSFVTDGALALNQNIGSRDSRLLQTKVGTKVSRVFSFNTSGTWMPMATLSYINKKVVKKEGIRASFIGQPGQYNVEYFTRTRHLIAPGVGIMFQWDEGGFVAGRFDSEFDSKYKTYGVSLEAGLQF